MSTKTPWWQYAILAAILLGGAWLGLWQWASGTVEDHEREMKWREDITDLGGYESWCATVAWHGGIDQYSSGVVDGYTPPVEDRAALRSIYESECE